MVVLSSCQALMNYTTSLGNCFPLSNLILPCCYIQRGKYHYPHFIGREVQVQGGAMNDPRLHKRSVAEPGGVSSVLVQCLVLQVMLLLGFICLVFLKVGHCSNNKALVQADKKNSWF